MNTAAIEKGNGIAASLNALLSDAGVPTGGLVVEGITVGVKFCQYTPGFRAWIPADQTTLIEKILTCFRSSGCSEVNSYTCEDIGAPGFVQIDATN